MSWEATKDSRIKRRHGVYWARFQKSGRAVEVSLKTKSFEMAKVLVSEIEADILKGRSWKRASLLFKDAWLDFLKDKAAGNKVRSAREKTLFEYAAFGVRYYLPFFGEMRLRDIDEACWREFVESVQRNHGSIQFFNIVKYMKGFFTWAKAHRLVSEKPYLFDPDQKKNREREEISPGRVFTLDELARMQEVAKTLGENFYLFFLMLKSLGMRPSEVTQLQTDRINLEQRLIKLRRVDTKTGRERTIPLTDEIASLLKSRLSKKNAALFVFPNQRGSDQAMNRTGFKKHWSALCEACGVEGRVYDLRHTFITHAIEQGMNPSMVASVTGTSIRIIERHYLHFGPSELKSAMERLKL